MDEAHEPRRRATLLHPGAEYALRAMACLARRPHEVWTPKETLVEEALLPPAYASKVMRRLVEAGLAEGRKGWHGGFRLAKRPHEIRFADILAAMGEDADLTHCAFGYPRCDASNPCALHDAYSELLTRVRAWARENTLADLGEMPDVARRFGLLGP